MKQLDGGFGFIHEKNTSPLNGLRPVSERTAPLKASKPLRMSQLDGHR
jgi:hypothetical protein